MSRIAFVTDTISCLPPEIIKEYGIKIISTVMIIDGKSYRDEIDMDSDTFWKQFDNMKSFSTAAPSPGDFVSVFKEAGKQSNEIICTLVSKALSATNQSAVRACAALKEEGSPLNINIVDSRTAAGAEGFVVLEGARASRAGKNKAEVMEIMQNMIQRVKYVNALETTKYLIKIGRAPKTVPIEVFAQLKPVIAQIHNTGLIEDAGVARSKEDSFQKMMDMIAQNSDTSKPLHVFVHYTNNIEDGRKLMEMVKSRYQIAEMYLTPYSALMGGTVGPSNAIAFYS